MKGKLHVERGPYTLKQVEEIYHQLMGSHFYDEDYNKQEWNPGPYRQLAKILAQVFEIPSTPESTTIPRAIKRRLGIPLEELPFPPPASSTRILDIGCGVGFLLSSFNAIGISCEGLEFSTKIFNRISPTARKYVRMVTPDSIWQEFSFAKYQLVVALEVFEHLPVRIIKDYLTKIHQECEGRIFLTIPSFGYDPLSGRALFLDSSPHRLKDIRENRVFSHLAMLDGQPGGGHITLASFRWWTDFFFLRDFVRDVELEQRLSKFESTWKEFSWCPYILRKRLPDEVTFSRGWVPSREVAGSPSEEGKWNTANGEILFVAGNHRHSLCLELRGASPNTNLHPSYVSYRVWELIEDEEDGRIEHRRVQEGFIDLSADNTEFSTIRIGFDPAPSRGDRKFRLELSTSTWKTENQHSGEKIWVGYQFRRAWVE